MNTSWSSPAHGLLQWLLVPPSSPTCCSFLYCIDTDRIAIESSALLASPDRAIVVWSLLPPSHGMFDLLKKKPLANIIFWQFYATAQWNYDFLWSLWVCIRFLPSLPSTLGACNREYCCPHLGILFWRGERWEQREPIQTCYQLLNIEFRTKNSVNSPHVEIIPWYMQRQPQLRRLSL